MKIEWTNERKDEIGGKFLFQEEMPEREELEKLEIQDLAFLINTCYYFHKEKQFPEGNFIMKAKFFEACMVEKLAQAEALYLIYSKNTGYPFIMPQDEKVMIYSDEEYAKGCIEHYKEVKIEIEYKKFEKEDIMKLFGELYRIGINHIVLDLGDNCFCYEFERSEILPTPDFSKVEKNSIPISNPELVKFMILYYQVMGYENAPQNEGFLRDATDHITSKILRAKFLIPMKMDEEENGEASEEKQAGMQSGEITIKENTKIYFPMLEAEDHGKWTPIFTDWTEFAKAYPPEEWKGQIVTFEDAVKIAHDTGITLNPMGTPIQVNEEQRKNMLEHMKQLKVIDELIENKTLKKQSNNLYLGDVRYQDRVLTEVVRKYCKKDKAIRKAYIRLKAENDILSFLLILDFEGDKEMVFPKFAEAVIPHLDGVYLDLHPYDDWARKILGETKPIYKKMFS